MAGRIWRRRAHRFDRAWARDREDQPFARISVWNHVVKRTTSAIAGSIIEAYPAMLIQSYRVMLEC
jgi:hypothetical protein